MSTIVAAANASTFATLVTKVRDAIGDPSSADVPRWTDTQIRSSIDMVIAQMWSELTEDPTGFLQSHSFTYDASLSVTALPAGLEANTIYKVEDITDAVNPLFIDYTAELDADRFPFKSGWFLQGLSIGIRPLPSAARTIRIWSVKAFPRTESAATTDIHSLPINHEELIVVGAAIRLEEVDDQVQTSRLLRYQELWEVFRRTASRYRGPMYVRNVRRFC